MDISACESVVDIAWNGGCEAIDAFGVAQLWVEFAIVGT